MKFGAVLCLTKPKYGYRQSAFPSGALRLIKMHHCSEFQWNANTLHALPVAHLHSSEFRLQIRSCVHRVLNGSNAMQFGILMREYSNRRRTPVLHNFSMLRVKPESINVIRAASPWIMTVNFHAKSEISYIFWNGYMCVISNDEWQKIFTSCFNAEKLIDRFARTQIYMTCELEIWLCSRSEDKVRYFDDIRGFFLP